jgi:hypothetical protein
MVILGPPAPNWSKSLGIAHDLALAYEMKLFVDFLPCDMLQYHENPKSELKNSKSRN